MRKARAQSEMLSFSWPQEITAIAAQHGAANVRLFGSAARGDETAASDLDLLVDFSETTSLLDHAALIIDLETALGVKVDVVSSRGLRPRVQERVLRDAIAL